MWLFTKDGFYSVVRVYDDAGKPHKDLMMVRARNPSHLNLLCEATGIPEEVRYTTDTDYAWRIIITQTQWTEVLSYLSSQIDYCNFKDEVGMCDDGAYWSILHPIWLRMKQYQEYILSTFNS